MKKAIVCHPVAAEGLYIEDGVHAEFAVTPEEFVSKITSLLDDKERRLTLGEQGRTFVEEHYDYKVLGRNLAKLYEDVAAQAKSETTEQIANA